jgi:hypothetical protein
MAHQHTPRQEGGLEKSAALFRFVLGEQAATQLPFVKRRGAPRFAGDPEQKGVGCAHAVPIVARQEAAKRAGDGVVTILLP